MAISLTNWSAMWSRHIVGSTQLAWNPDQVGSEIVSGTRDNLLENLTNRVESNRVGASGKAIAVFFSVGLHRST